MNNNKIIASLIFVAEYNFSFMCAIDTMNIGYFKIVVYVIPQVVKTSFTCEMCSRVSKFYYYGCN